MYADTDFILALLKDDDWLQDSAKEVYRKNNDEIWTSQIAVIELMIVCENEGFDVERKLVDLEQLIEIKAEMDQFLTAAHYMKNHGLHTFDALHAAYCGDETILSTDKEFEKLDIQNYNFRLDSED